MSRQGWRTVAAGAGVLVLLVTAGAPASAQGPRGGRMGAVGGQQRNGQGTRLRLRDGSGQGQMVRGRAGSGQGQGQALRLRLRDGSGPNCPTK